ncbi:hypothetical protein ACIRPX_19250 [Streptomyces sp. NPDC101225]|uniref:hypothetical protein n=1 Tax=Streptomyces sp. NPDC101225 TaxID=3366135 RepID=UPI00381BFC0F
MSWTRGPCAALAVCVLLLTGSAGCGSSAAHEGRNGESASPVGKVLDETDKEGRHYREVQKKGAPEVGIQVQPDTGDTWDVHLTVRNFRFSPAGTRTRAAAGHGLAYVFVDDRLVSRLRGLNCRLPARLVPRGTHHVTARLYADDGTVWAVKGRPIESTADITASEAAGRPGGSSDTTALSATDRRARTGGRGSPERAGKAS